MNFDTGEIIKKIQLGQDREVLDWMYKEIYPKVRKYILSNSGSADDSKDIFQETVLTFYKQVIDKKYHQIESIEGFMIRVSRNKWINRVRKVSREVELEDKSTDPDADPLVTLILNEKWTAFQKLFEMVGDKCRQILTYSTYEKLSMEEIALKMQLANANVAKTTHYRCKQKLIELVLADKELASSLKS